MFHHVTVDVEAGFICVANSGMCSFTSTVASKNGLASYRVLAHFRSLGGRTDSLLFRGKRCDALFALPDFQLGGLVSIGYDSWLIVLGRFFCQILVGGFSYFVRQVLMSFGVKLTCEILSF